MWLLGCGATCCVPFVIWSGQAAPVSASNTLLGSNKMFKETTESDPGCQLQRGREGEGTRRRDKKGSWGKIKVRQEESQTAKWEDETPWLWGSKENPKAVRFKLCHPVTWAIELLNVPHGKTKYNEKWSILILGRALQRCCKLVSSQHISYHFIPQS